MRNQNSDDKIISYLAALAPALLQLIAVTSAGITDVLKLDQYVFNPHFINLANFFVVLFSMTLISLSYFWDHNKFTLLGMNENILDTPKKFWGIIKPVTFWAFVFLSFFVLIVLNRFAFNDSQGFWSSIQWLSYIFGMTLISFMIFVFALTRIQKKQIADRDINYASILTESIRKNGHVNQPDIIIDTIDKNNLTATVRIRSDLKSKYTVHTDYFGEMTSIEKI